MWMYTGLGAKNEKYQPHLIGEKQPTTTTTATTTRWRRPKIFLDQNVVRIVRRKESEQHFFLEPPTATCHYWQCASLHSSSSFNKATKRRVVLFAQFLKEGEAMVSPGSINQADFKSILGKPRPGKRKRKWLIALREALGWARVLQPRWRALFPLEGLTQLLRDEEMAKPFEFYHLTTHGKWASSWMFWPNRTIASGTCPSRSSCFAQPARCSHQLLSWKKVIANGLLLSVFVIVVLSSSELLL